MNLPHLLRPLERGRLRLKNRVVFPGHQTLFSEGGIVGDRMLAYYRERARGGVGAVIVEGAAVHPTTVKFPQYLLAHDPSIVASLDRLADALHEHDCRVFLQLAHSGSRMNTQDTRLPLWAPSAVRSANSPEVPHAMTRADIASLLDGYETAARHVAASSVDGVEVHAHNQAIVPPMDVPHGVYASLAAGVRAAVDVPVIAVGRIKAPETAEAILAAGQADIVAVARALIADPSWVDKAAAARDELRPCIGCNQGCYGNLVLVRPITCTVNPAAGREDELGAGTETPAPVARRVVVVGGGPAGMEAALVAARRGHDVVLLEASDRLGGQVRLGAAVEARRELADIVDFQERRLARLGVDVRLGVRADPALIAGLGADDVVVAVGSTLGARPHHRRDDDLEGHRIGDCVAPRTVLEAVREGHLLGRRL